MSPRQERASTSGWPAAIMAEAMEPRPLPAVRQETSAGAHTRPLGDEHGR